MVALSASFEKRTAFERDVRHKKVAGDEKDESAHDAEDDPLWAEFQRRANARPRRGGKRMLIENSFLFSYFPIFLFFLVPFFLFSIFSFF